MRTASRQTNRKPHKSRRTIGGLSRSPVAVCLALTLTVCACSKSKGSRDNELETPSPSQSAAEPTRPAPSGAIATPSSDSTQAAATDDPDRPPPPALTDGAVRALVESWVAAQNTNDFDRYATHYAERFAGTKRAGDKVTHFDRKGWLADRKLMFKPGLHVAATDVELHVVGATARVRFVQEFASRSFADRGTKELIVASSVNGPKIAREEMLQSQLLAREVAASVDNWHVHSQVLFLGQAVEAKAIKPVGSLHRDLADRYIVEHPVDTKQLKAEQRALIGQAVTTLASDGSACEARIESVVARVDVVPHFGMVQRWEGTEGNPASTDAEIAADLWAMTGPSVATLAAKLDGCPQAVWASRKPPAGRVLGARRSLGVVSKLLQARLDELPETRRIQHDFEQENPLGTTTKWYAERGITVVDFEAVDGVQTAIASTSAGDGCAEFSAALTVLFEVDVRAEPKILRHVVLGERVLSPVLALDVDGDGQLELLTGPDDFMQTVGLWRRKAASSYDSRELWSLLFWDCPC